MDAIVLRGLKQSVRNCPWEAEFWVTYGRVQERAKVPHSSIIGICWCDIVG